MITPTLFFAGYHTQTVHFLGFELFRCGKLLKSVLALKFSVPSVLRMTALGYSEELANGQPTSWVSYIGKT